MPNVYKKSSRSYKKAIKRTRKGYKRRGRRILRLKPMVAGGLGLPSKYVTRLKYCDTVELSAPALTAGTYRLSANGLYDPDITSTGHQPLYFDQIMALYDHYYVLGSRVKIIVGYQSSGNVNPQCGVCIMNNDNTTSTVTSLPGITEQSQASKTLMLDSFNAKVLSKSYSAKKVFGGNILSKNELRGDASSNPTEDWYYDIKYQTLSGLTEAKIFVYFEISYLAVFTELKDIGQS